MARLAGAGARSGPLLTARLPSPPPPVLFLAPARWYGAHAAMRSLAQLGVRVFSLEHSETSPSNLSRHCAGVFPAGESGRPIGEPRAIVEQLLTAGTYLGGGVVLVAGTDEWAVFVAAHQRELAGVFRFPTPDPGLVGALASKASLFDIAARHGFPTPRVAVPASLDEAAMVAASLTYPVMIKPVLSRPDVTAKAVAATRVELLEWAHRLAEAPDSPNLLFQEYIPGGDAAAWMFTGYFDAESRCVAWFTGQKLRQCPAHMGHTSLGIVRNNPELAERAAAFLSEIGYRGIVDSGYRYDARDGTYKLLDVNPRVGGNFRQFVAPNGLDVLRAMYLDLLGVHVPAAPGIEGRRWLKEDSDLVALLQYRRLGELTLGAWARTLFGVDEAALFALSDPLPFLAALAIVAREYAGSRRARPPEPGRTDSGVRPSTGAAA